MKLVIKYGGTSISSPKDIQNVAKHIQSLSKKNQLVIVCSATSDTTDDSTDDTGTSGDDPFDISGFSLSSLILSLSMVSMILIFKKRKK